MPEMSIDTQQSSVNDEYYHKGLSNKKNWIALKPEQLSPRNFVQLSSHPDMVFATPK